MKEFKLNHIGREYFRTYFRNELLKNAKYKVKQKIEDLENKNLPYPLQYSPTLEYNPTPIVFMLKPIFYAFFMW